MGSRALLSLALVLSLPALAGAQLNSISFSFTIPPSNLNTRVSAAVYNSTGVLVRTLFGSVEYAPGTYTYQWDGRLDGYLTTTYGTLNATYTIKLLTDQVQYNYDGHVGTTDASWYGPDGKYAGLCAWYQGIPQIVLAGQVGWAACGYSEASYNLLAFNANSPASPYRVDGSYANGNFELDNVATDGTWVYFISRCTINSPSPPAVCGQNYVFALDAASGQPVFFNAAYGSTTFGGIGNSKLMSYIDAQTYTATTGVGIAVARNSNMLAVSHGGTAAQISFFDKRTGQSLGAMPWATYGWNYTQQLAFTDEGLWVQASTTGGYPFGLYLVTGLPGCLAGNTCTVTQPVSGLQNVMAINANTVTNRLYVADGGSNQQIYGYDMTTHTLSRTLGVAGGYNDCNPNLTHTRFAFDDNAYTGQNNIGSGTGTYYAWLAADDLDGIWVQDLRGLRIQHFDGNNNYVNRILSKRPNYYVVGSDTMPTRFFSTNLIEYSINYNVSLLPGDPDPAVGGNGAWDMVRDWRVCAMGAHGSPSLPLQMDSIYFLSVERLSNGRVYAQTAAHISSTSFPQYFVMWELPDNGTAARNTQVARPINIGIQSRNGTHNAVYYSGSTPNFTIYHYYATPTFNVSNNPVYPGTPTDISVNTNSSNGKMFPTSLGGIGNGGEASSAGYVPFLYGTQAGIGNYPHFGALKTGFSSLAWQASPEEYLSSPDYHGGYPGFSSSPQGIGPVRTEGNNFIYYYAGNYVPYGAQFYHYLEDGMFVGQFGNTRAFPPNRDWPANPTNVGNASFYSTTAQNSGNDIYMYIGDETYAAAHRWHISNLGSIHEYAGSGILQPNGTVTLSQISQADIGKLIVLKKQKRKKP